MKKKNNILIVGGTGFLGYHLAKKLLKKKFNIVSISNKKNNYRKIKFVKYIYFDISNYNFFNKIKKYNFDYVINCGGHVDHHNKKKTYASHYIGLKNLTKFFLDKKIKRFIQIGSSAEYGKQKSPQKENGKCNPKMIYGYSKLLATKHLLKISKTNNFPATIVRLYQVYGPYQSINRLIPIVVYSALKNLKFQCSSGEQKRDFLYIDDAVNAITKSLKIKNINGKIINIGFGKSYSIKDIINKILKKIKKGTPIYNKIKLRKDEGKIIFPDISNARKMLNWHPKIDLINGLNKTIKFYMKNASNLNKYN